MEAQAARWRDAAADWLARSWSEDVDRAIERNPDAVRSLAADGSLGDLKREVGSLIAAAGQVAEEEFGDEALWAHRGERRRQWSSR
jgi:hypothetical protein